MKTIVFVGAFNPITIAHFESAKFAFEQTQAKQVLFVPSKAEYIRFDQQKSGVLSDQRRLDLLRKVAKHTTWMDVSDIEIQQDHQPKTYNTLQQLKMHGYDCQLLIGSDKLLEIATSWANKEKLLSEFGLVCLSRNQDDPQAMVESTPLLKQNQQNIVLLHGNVAYQDISSSMVRLCIQDNRPYHQYLPSFLHDEIISFEKE